MSNRTESALLVAQAHDGAGPDLADRLATVLADHASLRTMQGQMEGKAAVLATLSQIAGMGLFKGASWSEPTVDGDTVTVSGSLPPGGMLAGATLVVSFDDTDEITHVEQQLRVAGPPPKTAVHLTDNVKNLVNGSLANGTPFVVAYVDGNGSPRLSMRGSTQTYGDDQLAIWVRNPEGGLRRALDGNPHIGLWYRDQQTRAGLQFYGRGHVDDSDAAREKVYTSSPEPEQRADPERKGFALIIDLDQVQGMGPDGRLNMERGA
jgi:hypothetical protein